MKLSTELSDSDGRMQVETFETDTMTGVQYLKIKILSGWTDFVTVHKVSATPGDLGK